MNIIELKSFLTVVEYRSISLAAKRLYVTPSAMTKRIQRLESELNTRLLTVDGVRIKLTEAGKKLIPYARQISSTYDAMKKGMSSYSQQFKTTLKIGTSFYLAHYLIYDLINYVQSVDERIIINVKTINEKDYLEQLDNGFIDLAICTTRSNQTKSLVNGKLWREELCICASDKHPLTIKDEVFLAELSAYEAVFPEEGGYIREKAEALFARHHLPLAVVLEAGTIFSVKNLVFSGNYWSVVHKRVLDESHLKIIKVPNIKLDIKFNWYCLNSRVQERTIEQTINHINNWIINSDLIQSYSLK
ncbi:LysR family transcriptional regulator [Legionella sainthelensi]|uniref:LysR family transcriptional regulator n=1 Tax=Legionella sainthelensi TaxID=28087 RepID=UPI000E2085BB|nr:LysR family transcriptional regulator [Legionella sainthelensi]